MIACPVCHSRYTRKELIDKVFCIDGRYVLVSGIPATVCAECGEQAFSSETAEKIGRTVNGGAEAAREVTMPVFEYAS